MAMMILVAIKAIVLSIFQIVLWRQQQQWHIDIFPPRVLWFWFFILIAKASSEDFESLQAPTARVTGGVWSLTFHFSFRSFQHKTHVHLKWLLKLKLHYDICQKYNFLFSVTNQDKDQLFTVRLTLLLETEQQHPSYWSGLEAMHADKRFPQISSTSSCYNDKKFPQICWHLHQHAESVGQDY